MGSKVDFDRLRKQRQRLQTVKRFIALGIIVGLVGGVIALNRVLIDSGFTVRISDMVESWGGAGYPIAIPGGIVRDIKSMDGDLAVLNDTNLYIYSSNGKTVTNLQQMTDNTVMVPTSSKVLTYDVGSKRYSVDTRSKNLLLKETDYSMLCADMNERGDLAIVTASKQYVAEAAVYNSKFEFVYGWQWSDNMVVDISLSPKGNTLAAGCINTQGGVLRSIFYILDFTMENELAKVEFVDEMVLDVQYLDGNTIGLLTDKQYRILSGGGTVQNSYLLGDGQLTAMERRGNNLLFLYTHKETRTQSLVLLDGDCRVLASTQPGRRIKDIVLGERKIYLLSDEGIATMNNMLEEKSFFALRGITQIHQVKNRLYYLTKEEICVLEG